MMRKTRKKFFLVFCFVVSLILALGFPPQIVASNNIPKIPTVLENIEGYSVEVPDWSQITWSSMPGFAEAGSIDFPMDVVNQLGYDPSRIWQAGANVSDVLMLGDISSMGVSGFALQQISNLSGINLGNLSLNDFTAMNWQSITSLTSAIPGLENIPIANIQVFSDLISKEGIGNLLDPGSTVGDFLNIAPEIGEIPLGDALDLNKYALSDSIPGLEFTSLESFKDWQRSLISQVPGLNSIPLSDFPLGIGFGITQVAIADTVFGKEEHGDPNISDSDYVSGEASGNSTVPKSCESGSSCAWVNLSDIAGASGPFYGKHWASGETQQVKGGSGALKMVNGGKEPTGRLVFGEVFKVAIVSTNESSGSARQGLYFRACARNGFVDLGCTPYFIGYVPWLPIQENAIVVMGGTPPQINIPPNFQDQIDDILGEYMPDSYLCDNCQPGDGIFTGDTVHPIANGTRVSSGYGWRYRPISGTEQFHNGVDFAAPIGTPVKSIDGGEVVRVGGGFCPDWGNSAQKRNCGGQLGNWVDVKMDNGKIVRYGHLKSGSMPVKVGMKVSKGQKIGEVGSSGWSTGPHLDLRIHDGRGNYENPRKYIPGM